ncbi:MAG: hypothetical protein IT292_12090 [Deltaproteobacteria bacterium]|nr:hypothetical protein [Deltaproteobacteria bacterium]
MSGEDTELDRTVTEKLADPLMHIVKNAVDRGIEPEIERIAKGRSAAGSVHLSASHSGGNIVISVVDDGKELDGDKLRKKAIEKGMITESTQLSPNEIYNLIFHPGFSTAEKVTDISGRSVGMDVGRNNIESMRGQVRIDSELGKGTTFTIELPLTLAIIKDIEVVVGTERFIIPTLSILEFMKVSPEMLSSTVGKLENFLFREYFLPLCRISELYNIEPIAKEITDGIVVVVESGREQVSFY